jgi:hypothetical protein
MADVSLEQTVFGPDNEAVDVRPLSVSDRLSMLMPPVVLSAVMVSMVLYSICKGIEYQDVFQTRRYRMYLLLLNAVVLVTMTALIAYFVRVDALNCVALAA